MALLKEQAIPRIIGLYLPFTHASDGGLDMLAATAGALITRIGRDAQQLAMSAHRPANVVDILYALRRLYLLDPMTKDEALWNTNEMTDLGLSSYYGNMASIVEQS